MTPDQMQSFMLKLADATKSGSVHNQVFVYREVLTKAYRLGHEDGLHAAGRDDFVRSEIESANAKAEAESDG
jgi:hypothetical protein